MTDQQNPTIVPDEGQHPDVAELARLKEMEARLHHFQKHPDYDYTTTTTGRKSGETKVPEGYGWLPNNHIFEINGDRNWERLDYTEVEYWYRRKEDALKDERSVYHLPKVVLEGVKRDEFFEMLRKHFNKGYMPSATGEASFNSKPEYCEFVSEIVNLCRGTGTYAYSPDVFRTHEERSPEGHVIVDGAMWSIEEKHIYFGVQMPNQPVQIFVDLTDPDKHTYVRTKRGDGSWARWESWYGYMDINVNRYDLQEQINVYG
jgi:hypothetical protein